MSKITCTLSKSAQLGFLSYLSAKLKDVKHLQQQEAIREIMKPFDNYDEGDKFQYYSILHVNLSAVTGFYTRENLGEVQLFNNNKLDPTSLTNIAASIYSKKTPEAIHDAIEALYKTPVVEENVGDPVISGEFNTVNFEEKRLDLRSRKSSKEERFEFIKKLPDGTIIKDPEDDSIYTIVENKPLKDGRESITLTTYLIKEEGTERIDTKIYNRTRRGDLIKVAFPSILQEDNLIYETNAEVGKTFSTSTIKDGKKDVVKSNDVFNESKPLGWSETYEARKQQHIKDIETKLGIRDTKGRKEYKDTVEAKKVAETLAKKNPKYTFITKGKTIVADVKKVDNKAEIGKWVKPGEGTKEVMKRIGESKHRFAPLARRLLPFIKTSVPINVVDAVFLGRFDKDKIFISHSAARTKKGDVVTTLIHETLHSITNDILKGNSKEARDFKKIYDNVLKHKDKFSNDYPLKNIREFMTGIFTDETFMEELSKIPSTKSTNAWKDIKNWLEKVFGIKGSSLLAEAIESGTGVIAYKPENGSTIATGLGDFGEAMGNAIKGSVEKAVVRDVKKHGEAERRKRNPKETDAQWAKAQKIMEALANKTDLRYVNLTNEHWITNKSGVEVLNSLKSSTEIKAFLSNSPDSMAFFYDWFKQHDKLKDKEADLAGFIGKPKSEEFIIRVHPNTPVEIRKLFGNIAKVVVKGEEVLSTTAPEGQIYLIKGKSGNYLIKSLKKDGKTYKALKVIEGDKTTYKTVRIKNLGNPELIPITSQMNSVSLKAIGVTQVEIPTGKLKNIDIFLNERPFENGSLYRKLESSGIINIKC